MIDACCGLTDHQSTAPALRLLKFYDGSTLSDRLLVHLIGFL